MLIKFSGSAGDLSPTDWCFYSARMLVVVEWEGEGGDVNKCSLSMFLQ